MTLLAEGISLKDGSNVLAKIASSYSNASMCLEREAHMCVPFISTCSFVPEFTSPVLFISAWNACPAPQSPQLLPFE